MICEDYSSRRELAIAAIASAPRPAASPKSGRLSPTAPPIRPPPPSSLPSPGPSSVALTTGNLPPTVLFVVLSNRI